jgi:hypothetical protein
VPEIPLATAPDRGHNPTLACHCFAYSTRSFDVTSRAIASGSRVWADPVEAGDQSDPALRSLAQKSCMCRISLPSFLRLHAIPVIPGCTARGTAARVEGR